MKPTDESAAKSHLNHKEHISVFISGWQTDSLGQKVPGTLAE